MNRFLFKFNQINKTIVRMNYNNMSFSFENETFVVKQKINTSKQYNNNNNKYFCHLDKITPVNPLQETDSGLKCKCELSCTEKKVHHVVSLR